MRPHAFAKPRDVCREKPPRRIIERGRAVPRERPHAFRAKTRRRVERGKAPPHIKLIHLLVAFPQGLELGREDPQFDFGRPGEQHVMKRVVLQNRHHSVRPCHALHLPQRVSGVGETVEALRAPHHVERAVGKRQPFDAPLHELRPPLFLQPLTRHEKVVLRNVHAGHFARRE